MDSMNFDNKFLIGHDTIDDQHRALINLTRDLKNTLKHETNISYIQDVFAALVEYAILHFNTEENLMLENNYKYYEEHKFQHDSFKNTITKYINQYNEDANPDLDLSLLVDYLYIWISNHILKTDMLLKEFVL